MPTAPTRLGDAARAYDIARVLVRFGAHDLVRRMGLEDMLAVLGEKLHRGPAAHPKDPAPVRLRRLLEELGPTFVKLGQVLATRVDLFEPEWIEELSRLQNHAPAVAWAEIENQLGEDLGAPPDQVFACIDHAPLAAASIAQVHRATLADGRQVVVKVRRPGIRPVVEADLRLMARLATAIEQHVPELRQFRPEAVVRQFRRSLLRELDLALEGRHAERIAANLADERAFVVPRIHWDYTRERVNVQDLVQGVPITDPHALQAAGIDPVLLARQGAQAVLRMMLHDGFFHADPHPGNVFALAGNRIALIDYGMVGYLSRERRREVVDLLQGLVTHDADAVADVLGGWADAQSDADVDLLGQDIQAFVDRYHGVALGELNLAAMLLEVTRLLRTHAIALPPELALVIKVCVTLEGLGRQLDPSFDMAREAAPFLRRAVRERFSARSVVGTGVRSLRDTLEVLETLPREVRALLRRVRGAHGALRIESNSLNKLGVQVARAANRLTIGVVLAALITGSSITMSVQEGPEWLGMNLFASLGFVGAVLAGCWLVISIWRSGSDR